MADLNIALEIAGHASSGLSAVNSVKDALGSLSTASGGFLGTVGKMATGFGALGIAAKGVGFLSEAIGSVGSSMVSGNAQMETYETQFGTLLGSVDQAKDRLAELAEFGAKTPFDLPEIAKAEKVLIGFGLTGEKALKLTGQSATEFRTTVGDIAAGTGASFEEIALNMGKMSAGATGEAMARFQEMGIVTKEQLAGMGVEFGKSGELMSPLPVAMQAIVKAANEKFGGGMDKLSATFSGQMSTLSDGINQAKNAVMQPIFNVLRDSLGSVNEFISSGRFQEGLKTIAEIITGLVTKAVNFGKEAFTAFLGVINGPGFQTFVSNVTAGIGTVVEKIVEISSRIGTFVASLASFESISTAVNRAFGDLIPPGLNPILDMVDTAFAKVRDTVGTLISAFQTGGLAGVWNEIATAASAFAPTGERIGIVFGLIRDALVALIPSPIKDFIAGLFDTAKGATEGQTALGILADVLNTVSGAIANTIKFVKDNMAAQLALVAVVGGLGTAYAIMTAIQIAHSVATTASSIATGIYTTVQWALNAALTANPIGLVVVALGALALALVYAYNNSEEFRDIVDVAFAVIKGAVVTAITVVKSSIQTFIDIMDITSSVINALISTVSTAFTTIKSSITGVMNTISTLISTSWATINTAVTDAMTTIGSSISTGWETARGTVDTINTGIKNKVKEVWDAIPPDIRADLELIGSNLTERFNGFVTTVSTTLENARESNKTKWGLIQSEASGILSNLSAIVAEKWGLVTTAVSGAMTTISEVVTTGWATISTAVSDAMTTVLGIVAPAWESIKTTISEAVTTASEIVTTAFEAIRTVITEKIGAALEVITAWGGKLTSFLGELKGTVYAAAAAIGQAILDGIKVTIQAGWAALESFVGDLARSLLGAAKAALKIPSSPSGEFMIVGEEIVNGIIWGVKKTETKAIDSLRVLGLNLVAAAKDLLTAPMVSIGVSIGQNIARGFGDNTADVVKLIGDVRAGSEQELGHLDNWLQGWIAEVAAKRTELLRRFNYAAYLRGEGVKIVPELQAVVGTYEQNVRRAFTAAAEALTAIAGNMQAAILKARQETQAQVTAAIDNANKQIQTIMDQRALNAMVQGQRDAFATMQSIQKAYFDKTQATANAALKEQENITRIHVNTMVALSRIQFNDSYAMNGPVATAQKELDAQTQIFKIKYETQRDLSRATSDEEREEITKRSSDAMRSMQDQLDEERAVLLATQKYRLELQKQTILENQRQQIQALEDQKAIDISVANQTAVLRNAITDKQLAYNSLVALQQKEFETKMSNEALQRQIDAINQDRDERIRGLNEALATKEKILIEDAEKERKKAVGDLQTRLADYKTEFVDKIQQAFRNANVDLADFIGDINGKMTTEINVIGDAIAGLAKKIQDVRQQVGVTPIFVASPVGTPAISVGGAAGIGSPTGGGLSSNLQGSAINYNLSVSNQNLNMSEADLIRMFDRMRLLAG